MRTRIIAAFCAALMAVMPVYFAETQSYWDRGDGSLCPISLRIDNTLYG